MRWTLQLDEGIANRVITYPGQVTFPGKFVRLRASGKTLILRAKPRRGAAGDVVRIAPQRDIKAGGISELSASGIIRFQLFWLFRSVRGVLALCTVALLVAGTWLTGEVAIRTTVTGTMNPHLAGQAWTGLALNIAGIVLGAVREFATG